MALFGSKEKNSSPKLVRPTVVRTQNVAKELFNIAKSYGTQPELLDFNILDVQTYVRINENNNEWESISNEELYELDEKKQILNALFEIKQTYEVEIFSRPKEPHALCQNMQIAIGANATKCKVYLSIAEGSSLAFDSGFETLFLFEINKRKVRAGMLINIFDEMLPSVVSRVSARLQVAESLVFEKKETLLIAEAYEPTATKDDALILHFEEQKSVSENERVDYASRDFITSVKKDELIIEYVKAKEGSAGRNCRGEYMAPKEPNILNEVSFNVDQSIRVEEDEDSIKYYAVENGYIEFVENVYSVKKEVDVGQISFKTTGSISSGVDSDVNITVSESDSVKDAIGTGMHVEVTEIDIDGNVGSKAQVIAKRASVGGQTHASAVIKADTLDINVHKGSAYGKNVHITRLEHGKVKGDMVDILQALGGTIQAKEIDIELCTSHVKATATRRIEIKKLQGSENIFTIDPLLSESAQTGLEENKEEIASLKAEVKDVQKEIEKYTKIIKDGKSAFLDIKKRLINYKKNGVKMPQSFVKKYKQYQEFEAKLKELENTFEVKADQLSLQTSKTSSFQDNILDARVINRDRWVGYNEIRFKLVDPPMELVHKPKEGSQEKIFGLVELKDGGYAIEAMDEGN